MPDTNGTKARTTAVKRARKTLATPYRVINFSLRAMNCGYRFSGQEVRISRRYRWPAQNDNPSPTIAPEIAAIRRIHGFTLALVAKALMAMTSVEPGTTVPTTGIASDKASRKIAKCAYCGCAETKSTSAEK